ncbi:MAG: hypothetical protein WA110_05950 [Anaerolineaceae bacterium]
MPYEVKKSKKFAYPYEDVYKSAYLVTKKLGGKVVLHQPENKKMHTEMDKKLQGKVLGDRSHLEFTFTVDDAGETNVQIFGYPLNAVGQKLMFGARPGVVETVVSVLFDEIEKKLQEGV